MLRRDFLKACGLVAVAPLPVLENLTQSELGEWADDYLEWRDGSRIFVPKQFKGEIVSVTTFSEVLDARYIRLFHDGFKELPNMLPELFNMTYTGGPAWRAGVGSNA